MIAHARIVLPIKQLKNLYYTIRRSYVPYLVKIGRFHNGKDYDDKEDDDDDEDADDSNDDDDDDNDADDTDGNEWWKLSPDDTQLTLVTPRSCVVSCNISNQYGSLLSTARLAILPPG